MSFMYIHQFIHPVHRQRVEQEAAQVKPGLSLGDGSSPRSPRLASYDAFRAETRRCSAGCAVGGSVVSGWGSVVSGWEVWVEVGTVWEVVCSVLSSNVRSSVVEYGKKCGHVLDV